MNKTSYSDYIDSILYQLDEDTLVKILNKICKNIKNIHNLSVSINHVFNKLRKNLVEFKYKTRSFLFLIESKDPIKMELGFNLLLNLN